jgi:hypothetical protein
MLVLQIKNLEDVRAIGPTPFTEGPIEVKISLLPSKLIGLYTPDKIKVDP